MPWVEHEPLPLEDRTSLISEWERNWRDGGDAIMGVFIEGKIAGGCGLHDRIGPSGLEIGYWTHPAFLRQGVATGAARLLTDAALALPGIEHVEIHHDKANEASAGVPRRLGYRFIDEVQDTRPPRPRSVSPAAGGPKASRGNRGSARMELSDVRP
jgi:ribosomal-protein-serine acetyltransferase